LRASSSITGGYSLPALPLQKLSAWVGLSQEVPNLKGGDILKHKYSFLQIIITLVLTSAAQADIVISDIQAIDLGVFDGGTTSTASDINDAGNIVGSSDTLSGETHAFFLPSGGVITDINTLPGGDNSHANGINDLNQVVGRSNYLNPITSVKVNHGFIWEGGVIRDLGAFPPEDDINSSSNAYAINNSGLIGGNVDLAGVVWDLFGTQNYPPFPPYVRITDPGPFTPAITFDINNAGQAAGSLLSDTTGFRWQANVLEKLVPLQAVDDDALGINELGEVVGRGLLAPPARYHAVFWPDPDTVQDLGTLGGDNSEAHAINNDRIIVGGSETAIGDTEAFVWHADFGMQTLGTLGGDYSKAFGVNSTGQIVGESETATGEIHATLWSIIYATEIMVDIKPGSDVNPINPGSNGKLPVAILSTASFSASTIDAGTIRFGPNDAEPLRYRLEDVDDDGDWDLVLKFSTQETGIACGDTEATLTCQTLGGDELAGTDSIKTVGCDL